MKGQDRGCKGERVSSIGRPSTSELEYGSMEAIVGRIDHDIVFISKLTEEQDLDAHW
jgi:hypothetical protein